LRLAVSFSFFCWLFSQNSEAFASSGCMYKLLIHDFERMTNCSDEDTCQAEALSAIGEFWSNAGQQPKNDSLLFSEIQFGIASNQVLDNLVKASFFLFNEPASIRSYTQIMRNITKPDFDQPDLLEMS
jgi:hypothetical protein